MSQIDDVANGDEATGVILTLSLNRNDLGGSQLVERSTDRVLRQPGAGGEGADGRPAHGLADGRVVERGSEEELLEDDPGVGADVAAQLAAAGAHDELECRRGRRGHGSARLRVRFEEGEERCLGDALGLAAELDVGQSFGAAGCSPDSGELVGLSTTDSQDLGCFLDGEEVGESIKGHDSILRIL